MRINKFLSTLGIASRRAIDKYIEEGRITVNGNIATTGMDISENDNIFIDGKKIKTDVNEEKVYFMLNKPLEVLSSSSDDRGRKTVVDLIKTDKRIFPIGRLDYMTSGLILLTNDGELFNRVVHPKSENQDAWQSRRRWPHGAAGRRKGGKATVRQMFHNQSPRSAWRSLLVFPFPLHHSPGSADRKQYLLLRFLQRADARDIGKPCPPNGASP